MIEDGTEHETVDTSVITYSKPFEFSYADCGCSYFSSFSESVEFFTTVHQITPSVSYEFWTYFLILVIFL